MKRGHAGSLIFTNFDRDALWDIKHASTSGDGSKRYQYWKKQQDIPAGGRSTLLNQDYDNASLASLGIVKADPNYSDQIPPFTITLTAMNEYGSLSVLNILGVELINEGSGVSIDDIVTETQMTFVARGILPWKPIGSPQGANEVNLDNSDVVGRINALTAASQAEALQDIEIDDGTQNLT